MPGALGMAMSRPRRRGYASGGAADDTWDQDTSPQPVAPADDTWDTPATAPGAMVTAPTQGLAAADKIALAQQGIANLQRQQQTNGILAAGGASTNLPLLAAAGAMLRPTHSGTFSESLGNAFESAVPVAEADRKRLADMQLRTALLAPRQQMADAATTRANASATYLASKAKYQALGMDERTAHDMALEDVAAVNAASRAQTADAATTRATTASNLSQQSLDLRKQALAALIAQRGIQNDAAAQRETARQLGQMTDQQIRAISAGKNPITGVTPSAAQAGKTVEQLRANSQGAIGGQPATSQPTDAAASLAAARAAIAAGKDRGLVIQRLRDHGIDPNGL